MVHGKNFGPIYIGRQAVPHGGPSTSRELLEEGVSERIQFVREDFKDSENSKHKPTDAQ